MRTAILGLGITCCAALAGCGDTMGEQALLGAGAGAGTSILLDGSVAGGALVGAAANVAYCNQYPSRCN